MILSVVIPIYNTLEYLPACLQSVEDQRFKDMELVLVDDGSDDGSGAFCDQYREEHPGTVVIHLTGGGASKARNAGLKAARGDYIHFVDSDDIIHEPDAYHDFSEIIQSCHPDMVFSRILTLSHDLSHQLQIQPAYDIDGCFEGDVLNLVLSRRYQLTMTSPVNKIFNRRFLVDHGLFFKEGIFHEEDEWLPRVIGCCERVYFYNKLLYGARYNRPGSLTQNTSEEKRCQKACSKIRIASMGMQYMQRAKLSSETLPLVAGYYWDYLIDACVEYNRTASDKNKETIYKELKEHRDFFDSYRLLQSRNRRVLGIAFRYLGIRFSLKLIGIRYGK